LLEATAATAGKTAGLFLHMTGSSINLQQRKTPFFPALIDKALFAEHASDGDTLVCFA